MNLEYIINDKECNMSIKDIVKKKLNVSSRLYTKISKDIYLNGEKYHPTIDIKAGDKITVKLDNAYENIQNLYSKFSKWEHDIDVIYEDEYILCINKEKGVPCHPSALHQEKTLYNAVINYYLKQNKIVPIHFVNRIDKDTTGIVLIAKHKYIQEYLSKQMQDGTLTKKYIAAIYGIMESKEGVIEKKIKRKAGSIILREVTEEEDADYAKTGYKVIGYNKEKNYTMLEVTLFTGRTHQIRVHFSSMGHPLLGDELYTKESNILLDNVYEYIDRQALHASEICFKSLDGKLETIKAKLPLDIEALKVDNFT